MSKRTNPFEQYAAPSSQMAKRLRRVEKLASSNKSEMKHKSFTRQAAIATGNLTALNLTSISLGNDVNQRVGNKVKIWRVEIRGEVQSSFNSFLIQSHTGAAPDVGDFNLTVGYGAMLKDETLNSKFTEWKYFRNSQLQSNEKGALRIIQHFKNGIVVKFNGSTADAVDNSLFYVCQNPTASIDTTINVTCRIWYTDN